MTTATTEPRVFASRVEYVNELADGQYTVGEFLGTEQQRDRVVGDKTYEGRFIVKLLLGDRVVQIEYRNEQEARERIGFDGLHRGDRVIVRNGIRAAKGFAFFYGLPDELG